MLAHIVIIIIIIYYRMLLLILNALLVICYSVCYFVLFSLFVFVNEK